MSVFRFLRGPATDMMAKFIQSSGIISSLVTLPLQGVINEVQGGQSWVGPGADKFLAVLTGQRVPASQTLSSQLNTMYNNFTRSVELIDQTDNNCKNKFSAFGDVASKIF